MLFRRRRTNRPWGAIEGLEDRALLAGDLTVNFAAGVLTITGDGSSTNADLGPVGGDLQLVGFDGTTINGSTEPFAVEGFLLSVEANLGGGNDIFRVRTTSADTINIDLGAGNDELLLASLNVTSSIVIVGGDGNDTMDVGICNIGTVLNITDSNGNDFVGLEDLTVVDDTFVNLSNGNDHMHVFRSTLESLTLIGDTGNDAVSIVDCDISGPAHADVGGGNDNIAVASTEFHQLFQVSMTPGKDKVMITASSGPQFDANGGAPNVKGPRGAVTGSNGVTIVLTQTNFTTTDTNPPIPDQNSPTTKKDVQKIYKKVFKGSRAKELGGLFGESSEPWFNPPS